MFELLFAFFQDNALWIACGIFALIAALVTIQLWAEHLALKILDDETGYRDFEPLNTASQLRYIS